MPFYLSSMETYKLNASIVFYVLSIIYPPCIIVCDASFAIIAPFAWNNSF